MNPDLSIVMPVYNEAKVIEDVLDELRREVCGGLHRAEIVVVNDASTDETAGILDRLAAADSRLKVHHAERNGGHGPALRRALDEARGTWIFQIDSDGQMVPSQFWDLWALRGDADLVMGMRRIVRNGRHRVIVSAGARWINRLLGGGDIRDVNVPFKLIHRRVWEDLGSDIPPEPAVPSLLIAVGAGLRWRVQQVAITSLPRSHGPSSVNLKALLRLSAKALGEVARFRLRLLRRRLTEPKPRAMTQPSGPQA